MAHALQTCSPCLALAAPSEPAMPLAADVATLRLGGAEGARPPPQAQGSAGSAAAQSNGGRSGAVSAHGDALTEGIIEAHLGAPLHLQAAPCGTALICFTSGASAAAKGVAVSHAALHLQSLAKLAVVGYNAADVFLHTAPLFHIGGISSALAALMAGCRHAFMPRYSPAALLDALTLHRASALIAVPTVLVDLIAELRQRTSSTSSSSSNASASLGGAQQRAAAAAGSTLPHVQKILVGAGRLDAALVADLARVLPHARILSSYGMTEGASSLTFRLVRDPAGARGAAPPPRSDAQACAGSHDGDRHHPDQQARGALGGDYVGCVAPGVQLAVLAVAPGGDPVHRAQAPTWQPWREGEVATRGPHVTRGYWGAPDATRAAFASGGWFRTGDVGYFDADGALWLCGRCKDVIKSGGENVHAAEVEAVLRRLPGVRDVAAVALADARLGEAVAALIVVPAAVEQSSRGAGDVPGVAGQVAGAASDVGGILRRAAQHSEGRDVLQTHELVAVQRTCRECGLSGFKVPRVVAVTTEALPRTAMGKVVKRDVLAMLRGLAPTQSKL